MTDYSARDIHLLDQALVDALEDVDGWTTDMDVRADLNERGIAIAGANLTAQLAENHHHMGLAGFAALATIRRIQEREQTKAYRVEMESLRAQLTAANRRNDGLQADLNSATKANTAWANENLRLREQVFAQKPVVEAAEAWAEMCDDGGIDATGTVRKAEDALHDAVESYRLMDLALTTARDEQAEVAR